MLWKTLCAAALVALAGRGGPAPSIVWENDWEAARSRAAEEGRPIFVALTHADEGRSERHLRDVYPDKGVVRAAEAWICVAACGSDHGKKKCPAFKGLTCIEHQRIDAALIEQGVVATNEGGIRTSPQHLWLAPDGALLLSVPLELTADEARWCFAAAEFLIDRASSPDFPEDARPPRRLLLGERHRPVNGDERGRGLTRDETSEALKTMRVATWSEEMLATWIALSFTDDRRAVESIATGLGSGALTWNGVERLNDALRGIGNYSPLDYASILVDHTKHGDASVRRNAAVGLEQMGTPEAVKALQHGLSREEDPAARVAFARALGACGFANKAARRALLKEVRRAEPGPFRNAVVIALGWSEPDDDVRALLTAGLASEDADERLAAACACALSRDRSWLSPVEKAREASEDPRETEVLSAVLDVLDLRATLRRLQPTVERLTEDRAERPRIFFEIVPE